ncbi:MAG: hypothetical protein U5K54_30110 [Cytophagales bacterium]|nr:hypothetical protein [Cytophagales bacterium]
MVSDYRPTQQVKEVYKEVEDNIDFQLNQLKKVMNEKVPKFNELIKQKQVNAVTIDVI